MPGILDEAGNAWHKEEECWCQMIEGVEGLHLCIPLQMCWFRNIEGRDPVSGRDNIYMTCIRHANLDAMLGKSPLTIWSHRRETLVALRNAANIGKTPAYHHMGMSLTVNMLVKSLVAKGRILDHVQFSTLRKMRLAYTKNWESPSYGVMEGAAFADGKYRVRQTSCPAQSEWFRDFLRGLKFRMGCQSDPNHGLLMGAIVHLLALMRSDAEEAKEAVSMAEADELWKVGVYMCILTAASLRGHEGFYLELAGLRKHLAKGRLGVIPPGLSKSSLLTEEMCRDLPHITICLIGKFKEKPGTDHNMISIANNTISGVRPRWWVEKMVEVCTHT